MLFTLSESGTERGCRFEVAADAGWHFIEVFVGIREDFFVLERAPGALDEDVVNAATSPVMPIVLPAPRSTLAKAPAVDFGPWSLLAQSFTD